MSATVQVNLNSVTEIETQLGIEDKGPIHDFFTSECAKQMDPFVPMRDGYLKDSEIHTVGEIRYTQPYSHYIYEGRVMGPNIPVFDANGNIVRWWSKAPKYYTGKNLVIKTDKHPLATTHWDQAMWTAKREDIEESLVNEIKKRGS